MNGTVVNVFLFTILKFYPTFTQALEINMNDVKPLIS